MFFWGQILWWSYLNLSFYTLADFVAKLECLCFMMTYCSLGCWLHFVLILFVLNFHLDWAIWGNKVCLQICQFCLWIRVMTVFLGKWLYNGELVRKRTKTLLQGTAISFLDFQVFYLSLMEYCSVLSKWEYLPPSFVKLWMKESQESSSHFDLTLSIR